MGIATIIVDQAEEEGWMKNCMFLPSVRNKKLIDSEKIQGHYLPVFPKVLGEGGRDDLGAEDLWRVLGLR